MAVRSSVRNSGNKRSSNTCTAGSGSGGRPPTRQRHTGAPAESLGREVDDGRQLETTAGETVPAVVVGQQRDNRQREEQREEDNGTGTSGGGSSESVVSVITEFTGGCSFTTNEKVALKQVVKSHVFPKMKYVHGPDDLAYGSDAFKAIKEGLAGDLLQGLADNELQKWWAQSKRSFVRAQINLRRNNVARIVKERFFGKQVESKNNGLVGLY